ncbi:MAG: HD-GYP domain-containing protein [Nitrospinota bacterium]
MSSDESPAAGVARPHLTSASSDAERIGRLQQIDLGLVGDDASLPFSIYGRSDSDNGFSLLIPQGSRLSRTIREKISKKYKGKVYILQRDWPAYAEKTDETLQQVFSDENSNIEEKSSAFYAYATEQLGEVFQRIAETGGQEVMLVLPIAKYALELVKQDWKATFFLLRLAQAEPRTYTHSLNVCFFGLSFIQNFSLEYSDRDLKEIAFGFLSHDIGELRISEKLLKKPTSNKLTRVEEEVLRQVPIYGHNILKEAGCDYPLTVDIVLNHHERMDGSGYPNGIREHEIPVLARLCAICEAFDTLTTPQTYRQSTLSSYDALRKMLHESPGQFDVNILAKFTRMMGGKV